MKLKNLIVKKTRSLIGNPSIHAFDMIEPSRKNAKILLGRMLARLNSQLPADAAISEMEFQVFSQFGDDGIIQFLISRLPISSRTFIEFGVEDYQESNTRFLLVNNRWTGLIIDGGPENVRFIKQDGVYFAHRLHVEQAFITRENINELLARAEFPEEVGLLSIDIDGNDYWIWEAINVVRPTIVVIEYNSAFGPENQWTIPYEPDFQWKNEGAASYYWGASLAAFTALGKSKGYDLFGCNSAGNNAYFIRQDRRGSLRRTEVSEAFVEGQFALGLDEHGNPVRGTAGMRHLRGKAVFDVATKSERLIP